MSPLEWLAVPAIATLVAAIAVSAAGRKASRGLSQEQRAAKLRAALDSGPTGGTGVVDDGHPA